MKPVFVLSQIICWT